MGFFPAFLLGVYVGMNLIVFGQSKGWLRSHGKANHAPVDTASDA